jgi:hypothetical protein
MHFALCLSFSPFLSFSLCLLQRTVPTHIDLWQTYKCTIFSEYPRISTTLKRTISLSSPSLWSMWISKLVSKNVDITSGYLGLSRHSLHPDMWIHTTMFLIMLFDHLTMKMLVMDVNDMVLKSSDTSSSFMNMILPKSRFIIRRIKM